MQSTFKSKLMGRRVLITIPKRKESVIELTPEVERQLDEAMIKQWTSLEVFAIGDSVQTVAVGDKVYISAESLARAERIPVGDETKMMVDEFDISIIW
jgi:hypothetical protein